jgi:hypothetical protein
MIARVTIITVLAALLVTFGSRQTYAARKDIVCTPVQVSTWVNSRIHVKCSSSFGGISYFALRSTVSSAPEVARVLTILAAARSAGRSLVITYDTEDTSGAEWGCQANDCRTIQAVGF